MNMKTGKFVPWFPPHPRSGRYAFRDRDSMLEVWRSHGGSDDKLPHVDFDRNMVVAAFLDEGTWRREVPCIKYIELEEHEIIVTVGRATFPFNARNFQSIFLIARSDLPVRFVDNKML